MKQRTQNEPDRIPPVATEAAARISSQPVPITGGDAKLSPASCWLDLKQLASVELGAKELPTEFASCALSQDSAKAWRPQVPGPQTIRLVFAVPQSIDKIRLVFVEEELERTHEFVLRWLPQSGTAYQEILRQQYVFSPNGSTREVEEYRVELRNLRAIELSIFPDIGKRVTFASLAEWGLGSFTSTPEQTGLCASRPGLA
jgi:hypothetical protein